MWLGTALGRFWAWYYRGTHAGPACGDDATEVWLVPRMVPGWAAGQAWGRIILIRHDCWDLPRIDHLLAHEYRHVEQWRRYGSAFVLIYTAAFFWALVRYGPRLAYHMNRFEREARGD